MDLVCHMATVQHTSNPTRVPISNSCRPPISMVDKENIVAERPVKEMEEDATVAKFKRVCVFCGSHSGNRKVFSDAAYELGNELVRRKIDLIYGGGSVGLMGLISKTLHTGGCHVLGVIPSALVPIEISGHAVGDVMIVPDMHQRKAEMARQADAFVALPGGYGTLEELLEIVTWAQLGIHDKPIGLLNVDGYYDCLLALFDKGVEEGFIKPSSRSIIISAATPAALIQKMEEYAPSHQHVAPANSWKRDGPAIVPEP